MRLDLALVARGLAPTRSRARDLIARGLVEVEGAIAAKPALTLQPGMRVAVLTDDAFSASRGALKLKAGLDQFGFSPAGIIALDVGASTGGFTELLLERGAARSTPSMSAATSYIRGCALTRASYRSKARTAARSMQPSSPTPLPRLCAMSASFR